MVCIKVVSSVLAANILLCRYQRFYMYLDLQAANSTAAAIQIAACRINKAAAAIQVEALIFRIVAVAAATRIAAATTTRHEAAMAITQIVEEEEAAAAAIETMAATEEVAAAVVIEIAAMAVVEATAAVAMAAAIAQVVVVRMIKHRLQTKWSLCRVFHSSESSSSTLFLSGIVFCSANETFVYDVYSAEGEIEVSNCQNTANDEKHDVH